MQCDSKNYAIRIKGHLDSRWLDQFNNLTMTLEEDGTTVIMARDVDQAALHGILERIRDLGIALLSVQCADEV